MRRRTFHILFTMTALWLFIPSLCITAFGKDFVVVIDAGHGGEDPGAIGSFSREKDINLRVALKVGSLIQNNCEDVKVIYTRKTDVFIPLDHRAEIANNAKADLFMSIHTNAVAKGNTVRGAETFSLGLARSQSNLEIAKRENSVILIEDNYKQRYAGFNPNSSESYIMFEFIQDKHMAQSVELATLVQKQLRSHAKRVDRGVHQAGFLVLRATTMPSILIELGYISTPDEEQYLNTDEGTQSLGTSIYKAFLAYKKEREKPLANTRKIILEEAEDSTEKRIIQKVNEKDKVDSSAKAIKEIIKEQNKKEEKAELKQDNNELTFKIQVLTSSKKLSTNDNQFKGLTPIDFYQEGGFYKYTYEASSNYNKVLSIKKSISDKFKDAFIIAFKNGEKININTAIAEFKNSKR